MHGIENVRFFTFFFELIVIHIFFLVLAFQTSVRLICIAILTETDGESHSYPKTTGNQVLYFYAMNGIIFN